MTEKVRLSKLTTWAIPSYYGVFLGTMVEYIFRSTWYNLADLYRSFQELSISIIDEDQDDDQHQAWPPHLYQQRQNSLDQKAPRYGGRTRKFGSPERPRISTHGRLHRSQDNKRALPSFILIRFTCVSYYGLYKACRSYRLIDNDAPSPVMTDRRQVSTSAKR